VPASANPLAQTHCPSLRRLKGFACEDLLPHALRDGQGAAFIVTSDLSPLRRHPGVSQLRRQLSESNRAKNGAVG